MANFDINQRVRIVHSTRGFEGREGTVVSEHHQRTKAEPDIWGYSVMVDNAHSGRMDGSYFYRDGWIEPLTPPHSHESILHMENLPEFECPVFELLTLAKEDKK